MDGQQLNALLQARYRDLLARKALRTRADWEAQNTSDRSNALRSSGLFPLPPKTDLRVSVVASTERMGFRHEKLSFFSRNGVKVVGSLYLPLGSGPFPAVVVSLGAAPWLRHGAPVQALGIGMALQGVASLQIDPPGTLAGPSGTPDRSALGLAEDPWVGAYAPAMGIYAWDLVRALDCLAGRTDIANSRIGLVGLSEGAMPAVLAAYADPRWCCHAIIGANTSLTSPPPAGHISEWACGGELPDRLACLAPKPIAWVQHSRSATETSQAGRMALERLREAFKSFKAEELLRIETIESDRDLNRRTREAVLAFLAEHLQGHPRRSFLAEKRPLTDGFLNPEPAGTDPEDAGSFQVLQPYDRTGTTFRDLAEKAMNEPYPEESSPLDRMVRWGRYGKVSAFSHIQDLILSDDPSMTQDGVVLLPVDSIDLDLCHAIGLGVPEFLAQVIHLMLPGGPEGWEPLEAGHDVLSSVLASVRSVVGKGKEPVKVEKVLTRGLVSSLVATTLGQYRPGLILELSHSVGGYRALWESRLRMLAYPAARYRKPI